MKRRTFLGAVPALLAAGTAGLGAAPASAGEAVQRLRAGKVSRRLGEGEPPSEFWGFNDRQPGPVLRYRKGERAIIDLENGLDQLTTVHWHGLRVPNSMDGVPFVTQKPVAPGQSFRYEFDLPDSGTYWYHPHQKSFEQVGRGMYGAFIVDEERPIEVDRELLWVLGDFRIDRRSGDHDPFGAIAQHAQEGRLGNVVTVNGLPVGATSVEEVRSGERVRFRLINAATARVFRIAIEAHQPWVVAFDGQGITPHRPRDNVIVLGPGMRVDLVLDLMARPGTTYRIQDAGAGTVLATLRYRDESPLRTTPLGAAMELQRNDLAKPNLKKATLHAIDFYGGDFGPPAIGAIDGKEIKYHDMKSKYGLAWTVNSHAAAEDAHDHQPLLVLKKGRSYILAMTNKTAFEHPIHLHGHFFRVLSYNGEPARSDEWRDTVFMEPWSDIEIALVASEPGDWMFHCHILEHAAAGMMGVIRIE